MIDRAELLRKQVGAQQIAVNRQYTEQIRMLEGQLRQLLGKDVNEFNGILKRQNIPVVAISKMVVQESAQ
jgi:hypothetical protein